MCAEVLGESSVVVAGLGIIFCFSFCLLWKSFIALSIFNDSFAG
jgi:hypothetical protein